MPRLGDAVRSTLRAGSGMVGKVGLGSALNLGFAYFDFRGRIESGQNPTAAMALAGGSAFLASTMGVVPYLLVTSGYGLAKSGVQATYSNYQSYNSYTRRMTTPFSHSFSHTDATYQMQQRGLAALGQARGALGSEAGMMAQLYGRR